MADSPLQLDTIDCTSAAAALSYVSGPHLTAAIITQYKNMQQAVIKPKSVFGVFKNHCPDLAKMFDVHKARFFKRTSSANWSTPPLRRV